MNTLLNLVANKKLEDFKDKLKQACDIKFKDAIKDLKQEVGKSLSK